MPAAIDLTGQRFGKLVVENLCEKRRIVSSGKSKRVWNCICDCGKKTQVSTGCLRSGHTNSCGCLSPKITGGIDLVGKTFGYLTVKSISGINKNNARLWLCSCVCGNFSTVITGSLTSGNTTSCGCYKLQMQTVHGHTKHSKPKSPEYSVWTHMLSRCNNENTIAYKHYGGRGINVCNDWLKFENFLREKNQHQNTL